MTSLVISIYEYAFGEGKQNLTHQPPRKSVLLTDLPDVPMWIICSYLSDTDIYKLRKLNNIRLTEVSVGYLGELGKHNIKF